MARIRLVQLVLVVVATLGDPLPAGRVQARVASNDLRYEEQCKFSPGVRPDLERILFVTVLLLRVRGALAGAARSPTARDRRHRVIVSAA